MIKQTNPRLSSSHAMPATVCFFSILLETNAADGGGDYSPLEKSVRDSLVVSVAAVGGGGGEFMQRVRSTRPVAMPQGLGGAVSVGSVYTNQGGQRVTALKARLDSKECGMGDNRYVQHLD